MATITIQCPGQPDQVLELRDRPLTVGRGEDCSAFIAEKKASRKHLTIRARPGGGAVAEDHSSSNGTWFVGGGEGGGAEGGADQRFLRRVLSDGDQLRIGETLITFAAGAPASAASGPVVSGALVSGTLQLTPAVDPAPAASGAAAPEPVEEVSTRPTRTASVERESEGAPAPRNKKSMGRAIVVCMVAVALFATVEIFLGASAKKSAELKTARLDALKALETMDKGLESFQSARDAYAQEHPNSRELLTLNRYLKQLEEREAHGRGKHQELATILGSMGAAPRSEVRFRLLQMRAELPEDEAYQREIRAALAGLDRQQTESDLDDLRQLEQRVDTLVGAQRFSQAARLVASFEDTHEGMQAEAKERWTGMQRRVDTAYDQASKELWTKVGEEKDPLAVRRLLADAWPRLVGTRKSDPIGDRLRSAASLAVPHSGGGVVPGSGGRTSRPGAGPGGRSPGATNPGAAPAVPTVSDTLLARATKAEEMVVAREWAAGRTAYAKLAGETEGGRLLAEWKVRLAEVDQILALVSALSEASQEERKPRRKLSDGTWKVVAATPETVTLESKRQGTKIFRWSERPPADALALLTPTRMSAPQRMAVAVLAAGVSDRAAFVDAMIPVYEAGGDLAAANQLVARHLYGRAETPEGGYNAYKGELLDATGLRRRQTEERIASLRTQAETVLAKVAGEPAFKKLGKLKGLRAELDKRRKYALTAIFNTTHYPYPANKGATPYRAVQEEIDRRVKSVAEIWDNPLSIRIKRAGKLAKLMDEWSLIIAELDAKSVDTAPLKRKIEPYALYVTDEPIGIRSFYKDDEERQWLAYCDWVIQKYNPARREEARDAEHRQVAITNAYRMMMGYTAVVTPGPAPVDSIDRDNVVKILDQAELVKVTPLRAVRIDNRLVKAARLHSEDMARRGYFAHQAPPDPATGRGPTGPADRMQRQQYQGWSYSENIAMSASPQQAHDMWCHSSGHHRNILSGWTDLGSGVGGRNFTQNFAGGGGARPEIYPDTTIRNRKGGGGRGRTGR